MTPPTRLPSCKEAAEPVDPRVRLDEGELAAASTNGFPVVATQLARRDRAGLLFGAGIAMLLGAITLFGMTVSRSGAAPTAAASMAAAPDGSGAANAPAMPSGVAPQAALAAPVPGAGPGMITAPVMGPGTGMPPGSVPPMPSVEAPAGGERAPALVFDSPASQPGPAMAAAGGSETAPAGAPAVRAAPRAPADGLTPDEQFARRIAGEDASAGATPMPTPAATVAQGTLIAAVLETAINSDLPGYVRAVISREVRSFDGRNVLIPRGSHVIGEYKSGLAVGQTRAFVLWTRLLRPDGVSVALGSPATDSAGSNGLPGKVSNHFGKRFGAAILMSLISAGGQAIGGGGAVIIAAPSQAASSVAQRDINIPPTVRVAAGTPIRIFVARDLDFTGYEGAARAGRR